MDERWEAGLSAALNLLYAAAVLVLVAVQVPGLREPAARAWARQVHAWRVGRWLASVTRPPAWTDLLGREDLPQERA